MIAILSIATRIPFCLRILSHVLNAAYRGAKFGISPIAMLAMGNELEYRQASESLEEQVSRERGYMDQGRALSRFLEHPVDNIKSFAVSYFENSRNFSYCHLLLQEVEALFLKSCASTKQL